MWACVTSRRSMAAVRRSSMAPCWQLNSRCSWIHAQVVVDRFLMRRNPQQRCLPAGERADQCDAPGPGDSAVCHGLASHLN